MSMKQKKNKGISLIVLIITIVVIIILAAAIILNLSNTNLIENANEAVVKQDFKTLQEELDMKIAQMYIDEKGTLDITTVDANTKEEVANMIPSITKTNYADYVTIVDGKIAISDSMPDPQKTWAMEALGLKEASNEVPTEPEGTPVVDVNTKVETANATITGENFAYNNPVIPVGFKAINTTDASWEEENGVVKGWNDGLVIQDEDLNEFVWVPCTTNGAKGTIAYTRRFDEYYKLSTIKSASDDADALPTGITNETTQITTYGGFYVGRYEAGVPTDQTTIDGTSKDTSDVAGTPVVKKDATVWTRISYNNAMPNAKKIYENSTFVKSGIVTGTAWDTVCAWIQSETDPEGNPIHSVIKSSKSWGNYPNSISPANVTGYGEKQVTGYSEYWKAKNIYDFAGNTKEWTGEIFSYGRIIRSGSYYSGQESNGPASTRLEYCVPYTTSSTISFRVMLFVI